jgi:hypothetical protein
MWTRVIQLATVCLVLAGIGAIGAGREAQASHPGNNGRLVYVDRVESGYVPDAWAHEIFTMNVDGSDVRRLTFDSGREPWFWISENSRVLSSNHSPAWSPNGDVIAYVHREAGDSAIRSFEAIGWPASFHAEGQRVMPSRGPPDPATYTARARHFSWPFVPIGDRIVGLTQSQVIHTQ